MDALKVAIVVLMTVVVQEQCQGSIQVGQMVDLTVIYQDMQLVDELAVDQGYKQGYMMVVNWDVDLATSLAALQAGWLVENWVDEMVVDQVDKMAEYQDFLLGCKKVIQKAERLGS